MGFLHPRRRSFPGWGIDDPEHRLVRAKMRAVRKHQGFGKVATLVAFHVLLAALLCAAGYPFPRILAIGCVGLCAWLLERRLEDCLSPGFHSLKVLPPVVIVAITGGVRSPMFPAFVFGCAPFLMLVAYGERRGRWMWAGAAVIAVMTFLPEEVRGPALPAPYDMLLTGGTMVVALSVVGTLVERMEIADRFVDSEMQKLRGDLLHEALERSRTFEAVAAKVGHELKTPIAAIRVLADIEHRHAKDDASRERLATVIGEARRMQEIVNDYLVLAKPVEALEIAPYDLSTVIGEVASSFRETAERAGVEVRASADSGTTMRGDRRRIREALTNLVSNAVQASERGGVVSIDLGCDDDHASVEVRDEGRGIPAHLLPRVGTAFFTTREGGTGLGVVLARTVVMQHGGRLSIDSQEGLGTTVHVVLPRHAVSNGASSIEGNV
ncbi:sensor histidine kinase [Sandaracinus amylolyticus]|uniref:histidine kinase n=1 Tax=Sandaracinus amylolyticus TaxID=927083 RepID=A0A0F6VZ98_9BACT|nr:HAMP domain-containing sensor histidine kinase [Sandaracinus amylolyticus]AKF03437.1 integral membrane sensor signal transduction histidine kinase [Sandaracinus amylolyticus]